MLAAKVDLPKILEAGTTMNLLTGVAFVAVCAWLVQAARARSA